MSNEKEISIDQIIEDVKETKEDVSKAKAEAQKAYTKIGNVYNEYERLEQALDGTISNLDPLSGHIRPLEGPLLSILGTSIDIKHYTREQTFELKKISDQLTDTSSLSASGSSILANSTNAYSMEIKNLNLCPVPPSIEKNIEPYAADEYEVEEEVKNLLNSIDPSLNELFSEAKEIFKTPHRNRLDFAATEMRKLIWEILRKLAPHDKVCTSHGFIQDPNKDLGVATYRQQVAYILTGEANFKGPKENLINSVFEAIERALKAFSGKIKAIGGDARRTD